MVRRRHVDHGRRARGDTRPHGDGDDVLVVLQRAHRRAVVFDQIVPGPADTPARRFDVTVVADDVAVDALDADRFEGAGPDVERVDATRVAAVDRGITRAHDDQVAVDDAVDDRSGRDQARLEAEAPAKAFGGRHRRQDLHRRGRHEPGASVAAIQCLASGERPHDERDARVLEGGGGQHALDDAAQRVGARGGRRHRCRRRGRDAGRRRRRGVDRRGRSGGATGHHEHGSERQGAEPARRHFLFSDGGAAPGDGAAAGAGGASTASSAVSASSTALAVSFMAPASSGRVP